MSDKPKPDFAPYSITADVQAGRPSVAFKATLSRFGDTWVASYGEFNASGPSPADAMTNFDTQWFVRHVAGESP